MTCRNSVSLRKEPDNNNVISVITQRTCKKPNTLTWPKKPIPESITQLNNRSQRIVQHLKLQTGVNRKKIEKYANKKSTDHSQTATNLQPTTSNWKSAEIKSNDTQLTQHSYARGRSHNLTALTANLFNVDRKPVNPSIFTTKEAERTRACSTKVEMM